MTDYEKLLVLVHTDPIAKADAIILLEGDGKNRLKHAAKLYNEGFADKIVFSGGVTNYGYGSYPLNDCLPELLSCGVKQADIIEENRSTHTGEQAEYVCEMARQNGWKRLILVATPHHQCRAYLTFLKQAMPDLVIINSTSHDGPWYTDQGWGCRIDLLEQEDNRIDAYTKKGDLATVEQALEYQKWKEKQL